MTPFRFIALKNFVVLITSNEDWPLGVFSWTSSMSFVKYSFDVYPFINPPRRFKILMDLFVSNSKLRPFFLNGSLSLIPRSDIISKNESQNTMSPKLPLHNTFFMSFIFPAVSYGILREVNTSTNSLSNKNSASSPFLNPS